MERVRVFLSYLYFASEYMLGMLSLSYLHCKVILPNFSYLVVLCRLRPSTQKVLSLAAKVKTLEKEKEHLRMNLSKAEEEVRTNNFRTPVTCWNLHFLCQNLKIYLIYIGQSFVWRKQHIGWGEQKTIKAIPQRKEPPWFWWQAYW